MEGEQKRVFLVLADDEKSICFDSKKYVDSCFRMPNGGRSPYHSPEKGKNKGECL